MNDSSLHSLAAAYALDAVDDSERAAFEAHLGECDACRHEVADHREAAAALAAATTEPPPAALRARVLAEVARTAQSAPSAAPAPATPAALHAPRRRWPAMVVGAAAAAALVAVGVVALTRDTGGNGFPDELAKVLEQPDGRMLQLQPQGVRDGEFKVAWSDQAHEAVLIGEALPPAPAGKAYELWLVTPQQSMAMYVLDPARNGQVHRSLHAPQSPSAWAITVEPVAGSAVATGDIIFIGKA